MRAFLKFSEALALICAQTFLRRAEHLRGKSNRSGIYTLAKSVCLIGSVLPGNLALAAVTATPTTLSWAYVPVGSKGGQKAVTLTNTGTSALSISSVALGGANSNQFQIYSKTCGSTLAASASCTANIIFGPTATGNFSATLTFTDSDATSPQVVTLTGKGTSTTNTISASPTSLSFGSVAPGSSSAAQSVTLANGGSTTDAISSIAISGPNAADFTISSKTCGTSLNPTASCTVSVVFKPAGTGNSTATLTFTDAADNSPQAVSLSGTGATPTFTISPTNPSVPVNGTVQFSATTSVTWKASCGTIGSTSGSYVAPASTGSCNVTATQTASPNSSVSGAVKVTSAQSGTLAVYPATAAVMTGTGQVFQAQLSGVPDSNSLSYSVDGVAGGNATAGTITNLGVYTAPASTGVHQLTVKDNALGTTADSWIRVYSSVWVDFGSRAANDNPVPADLFAAQRLESLHNAADLDLVKAAGVTQGRLWAQIPTVFSTSTPNWNVIDSSIRAITAVGGMHVMLEMYQTPVWLQPSGSQCGVYALPANLSTWGSIAAQYVKHMDATFPGVVTDYEIWNEPNIAALCVPAGDSQLTDYMNLYKAAAPLMKAQAKTDGATIRVGGPVSAGLDAAWVTAMLNDPTIAQNIDFMSFHQYLMGGNQLNATWDTYNGTKSVLQATQDTLGVANAYAYAGSLIAGGKQPQGKNLPVYITEYNLNWTFNKNCCQNDNTYGPLWNALYVADMLNEPFAYSGAPNSMGRMVYYAATAPPYYCLVGTVDSNMDCSYPTGSTAQPYPQYFTYQLFGSSSYLGLQNGGFMASAISPPTLGNGLVVTAFFTSNLDSVVLINPSKYTYQNMQVWLANTGYKSPTATLYQIVNGQSIQSSTLSLQPTFGTGFGTTVAIPPYSVQAISLH